MNVRFWHVTVALATVVTAACPYDSVLSSTQGIAISGGGGGGTGTDALSFIVQPGTTTAGNIITPAVIVAVRDSLGTPDSSYTQSVTMSIGINPVGGRLSGTLSIVPVNGLASFGDLVIDQSGAGYVLRADSPNAHTASSASFTVLAP